MWGLEIFFLGLPGWFIAVALYAGASYVQQRMEHAPQSPPSDDASESLAREKA